MASSTTGEQRWASTKKGGMTVLGKVAVPKPINLPSQRLENHGLDPNVELVPKGSLTWGARSSSSGSNAWGSSSALSSKTEGGSASPSHLSGRPSSSGGTRPSTAGSERTPDSTSSVWTSNSRPSCASGPLTSSNTSLLALRPRSAETRPGSSQLSRFAEPLHDSTAAQGASGSADQLGIIENSSNDGFSLSTGDFPTLGSEKNSGTNRESLDNNYHGRPGSSSGVPSATRGNMEGAPGDDVSRPTDVESGMVNSWKNDGPQPVEDGFHPGMENWHGDPYSYPNPNICPQFYENWRGGAPLNPLSGVWFRGPPGAPYGAPPMAAPGGFPMEPFPYYHPHVSAPGLVNSQTVPPHSSGPRGPHSKSGDFCRPIAEPYIRPGMPIRPGFYPGYYGLPMGFWNPNERDFSFMGVPAGLPVYNRYPNQNVPESTNANVISCDGRTLEKVEHDSQRCYSAPVNQNLGRDKRVEEEKWGHKVTANAHHPRNKDNAVYSSSQENLWTEDHRKDENMNHRKVSLQREEASYAKFPGRRSRGESDNVNPALESVTLPRDHRMMKNIEGLDAVVRVSDRRHSHDRGQVVSSEASHSIKERNTGIRLQRHYPSGILVPVDSNMTMLAEDEGFVSTNGSVIVSRLSTHKFQARGDNGGKGRFNRQEADGLREKGATSASPSIVLVGNSARTTNNKGQLQPAETEMPLSDGEMMDDSCDSQRDKMREIVKLRAMKLQKEEEERIREQKAKAFAKLEELNRRTANQSKEAIDKAENVPHHADVVQKREESNINIELCFGSIQSVDIGCTSAHVPEEDGPVLEQKPILEPKDKSDAIFTVLKEAAGKRISASSESNTLMDLPIATDSLVQPKRKQTRAGKNKHKVDESFAVSLASVQKESDAIKCVTESIKLVANESKLEPLIVKPPVGSEDISHRGNNSGKPQHARNMPRHPQARSTEKSYSNDAVVWAPVRSQNKTETPDDNSPKPEGAGPSTRSVNAIPSSSKSKRAELERYIPKAAIKESAQQGNSRLSASPSTDQSIPDSMSGKEQASSQTTERTGRRVEPRHVGSKSKPMHSESQSVQVSGNNKSSSGAQLGKAQSAKQDEEPAKQHSHQPGEINQGNVVDGWNIVDEPVSSGAKDHETFGSGKRHPFKDHRGSRKLQNFDHKNQSSAEAYVDYSETCQADRPSSSKGKSVAQWQPKSQTHVTNQHNNQDTVVEVESAPVRHTGGGTTTEQRPSSSGHRKNGTYNGRFNRGCEFHRDPSFIVQDNRHNYASINQEKQKQNSQYEYRPVGPESTNKRGHNSEGGANFSGR